MMQWRKLSTGRASQDDRAPPSCRWPPGATCEDDAHVHGEKLHQFKALHHSEGGDFSRMARNSSL